MELPKNITQIGEADRYCKIYVEDYVVSYMKQLNQLAMDKDMAVALYGVRREEGGVTYLFVYGAGKLNFLYSETRNLSQAQQEEAEEIRCNYFRDDLFLGYGLLNGEMLEGFYICEQGICRYISGYAQFYEKNERMLAYMLDARKDAPTEDVDRKKYEEVKKRQEERRVQYGGRARASGAEQNRREEFCTGYGKESGKERTLRGKDREPEKTSVSQSMHGMRAAVVVVFTVLCLVGLSAMNGSGGMGKLQMAASHFLDQTMEKQLPDTQKDTSSDEEVDTLIAEDKLTEAVLQENEGAAASVGNAELSVQEGAVDKQGEGNLQAVQQVSASGIGENGIQDVQASQTDTGAPAGGTAQTGSADQTKNVAQTGNTTQTGSADQTKNAAQTGNATQTGSADQTKNAAQTGNATQPGNAPQTENTPSAENKSSAEGAAASRSMSYTIKEGDTLIGISVRNYGSDKQVNAICSLNQINNPDDIKVGQTILLP